MTLKQQKFCDYYLATGNATEAAIKAGYSEQTARSIGSENLSKPDIQKYLSEHSQKAHNSRIADANEVLEYLSETMRDGSLYRKDRTKAAELLGKRYGLYNGDDTNETSDHGVTINVKVENCHGT